jgi:hypothetical protein
MTTAKISQLSTITKLNENTSNTLFLAVDIPSGITGKFTGKTLAQGLYSNEILNVGTNHQNLPNTIAQFSLGGASYIQTNLVNTDDGGTADIVVTANTGSGGTDAAYFTDMGFANKNVQPGLEFNNLGSALSPLDGYLYVQGASVGVPSTAPGGNLILGTTTTNTQIKIIAGGYNSSNVVSVITADGFKMVNGRPIFFTDGTTQNTAAAPFAFSNSAYNQANTANTLAQSAYNKVNTAVQNTASIQLQTLTLTGNLIANSAGQGISADTFTSNNATFSKNVVVLGNLTANTLSINDATGTVNANTIIANTFVYGSATANAMVTQLTSKSTAVTANGMSGQITMNNASLAGQAYVTFTVNNSYVQHVNDIPFVAIQNGVTTPNPYLVCVGGVAVGSFNISVHNSDSGGSSAHADAIVLNWGLMRVGN